MDLSAFGSRASSGSPRAHLAHPAAHPGSPGRSPQLVGPGEPKYPRR